MKGKSCVLYPQVNGKDSILYKKLLKEVGNRSFVNWVYANYLTSNIADQMDQADYKRDANGEHSAKGVMDFLEIDKMLANASTLHQLELQVKAIDSTGARVNYTNAEEALQKASDFNDDPSHNGVVATVVQHGDIFNIILAEKNSRTNVYDTGVKQKLKVWNTAKQAFNSVGIDIENLPQELKSIISANQTDFVRYLQNLKNKSFNYMYKKDALLLFSLNPSSTLVQRAISHFGSAEAAAQAVYEINQGIGTYTAVQERLLANAVRDSQNFNGLDLDALQRQIDQMLDQVKASNPEEEIKNTLHRLNKQYKIDSNAIHRINTKINTLSEAAADAVFVINRKIRELEEVEGNNLEGKRLSIVLNRLLKELASNKYYSGMLSFLGEASTQLATIDDMLNNLPQTGTEIEKAFATAKIIQNIKKIIEQYSPLINALADESLTIDESITQQDIDNIRTTARQLKDQFIVPKEKELRDLTHDNMMTLMLQIIGSKGPDGQSIINAVNAAAADSSWINYLYSMGRADNPVIGAMGAIIRNAQDDRNIIMNNIAERIRKANHKLLEAGYTSEFMYEADDVHIISDINWELYAAARKNARSGLIARGYKGFDLKQAMEEWEYANTEERVVDSVSGRKERVPNTNFRKQFPNLAPAQKEYYDTMMQIKGEIGTLLPTYAQKQYLAPQVRRNMVDGIESGIKKRSIREVGASIWHKVQNLWTIREDDDKYNTNGIIDGNEYGIVDSDFDNTPLRRIPIFFINKVQAGELLKDFSTGLQHLAGTAINYDAMQSVVDVVEFMGDFVKNQDAREDTPMADAVGNATVSVFKDVIKKSKNSNTINLVEGFISQHIYGQKRDPNENAALQKLMDNIIGYTSFKGLATNVKGALSNYIVGEFQMLIEAGAGEFYGISDYAWAHLRLFGNAGVPGEFMDLMNNNQNSKATLFREMFDPIQENFSDKSHQRYYNGWFRQLIGHDCSFIGYATGEFLIHYVNMYAILNHEKVFLNGKKISLYDAFEKTSRADGNSELRLKAGVTIADAKGRDTGQPATTEYLQSIKRKIRYANQSCHGSMNEEDKGLIHQRLWGRAIMNFRQWMVEHYSRRFRGSHFDASLGEMREGYWVSMFNLLSGEDTKDALSSKKYISTVGLFMRDLMVFAFRAQSQWDNLTEMQKYNVKRVRSEMAMFIGLLGLSFSLGEPDEHKKDFWRRWWIYQVKRLILEVEASMPVHPAMPQSLITILQSPMASISTMNSMLYILYGLPDITEKIKSGPHKGENRYIRNVTKNVLPFIKDYEQLIEMDTSDAVFKVFEVSPNNH